ncbi:hypothetical protein ACFL6C_11765 [Myxococcota bacterium]
MMVRWILVAGLAGCATTFAPGQPVPISVDVGHHQIPMPELPAQIAGVGSAVEEYAPFPGHCKERRYRGDGSIDEIVTRTYDDNGYVESEITVDENGQVEWEEHYTHDADGRETFRGSGVDRGRQGPHSEYVYENDRLVEERSYRCAGDHPFVTTFIYDGRGHLVCEELRDDGRGPVLNTIEYENDEHGNPVSKLETPNFFRERFKSEESPPERTTWTRRYDEEGRVTREVTDSGADGRPDHLDLTSYDRHGRVVRHTQFSAGLGMTADEVSAWGTGKQLLWRLQMLDGHIPNLTVYEHDRRGNPIRKQLYSDGDGEADQITTYEYDCWEAD